MTFRTPLAAIVVVAGVALLSACGGVAPGETDSLASYPDYTAAPTDAPPPNPLLTDPGTVLPVGQSAILGYHSLAPDASGTVVPSPEEQLVKVTVTSVSASSIGSVPKGSLATGADSDVGPLGVKKFTWTAEQTEGSVLAMADVPLEFGATGAGAYVVASPSAIRGCPGPATLGAGFDSGSPVTGCFLVVYALSGGAPNVTLGFFRTPTESDPIVWTP